MIPCKAMFWNFRGCRSAAWLVGLIGLVLPTLPARGQDFRPPSASDYAPAAQQPAPGGPWVGVYPPPISQYPDARAGSIYAAPAAPAAVPAAPGVYTALPAATPPDDTCPGGWIAGVSGCYFQPRWGSNPAYGTTVNNANYDTQSNIQQDFQNNGQFAPLLCLGYVDSNGVGIRGRWSHFHGSNTQSVDNPAQSDPNVTTTIYSAYPLGVGFAAASAAGIDNSLQFYNDLTMDVADLELLRDVRWGRGSLLFGAGVRYAHLSENYTASWLSTPQDPTQDVVATELTSGHNFNGIGPLLSLEARYPVGNAGLALLANWRGALLFGTGHQSADLTAVEDDPSGNLLDGEVTKLQSGGGTLPVLECEVGAEWSRHIGRADFMIQAALIGQAWFYMGNAANQQSIFATSLPANSTNDQDTLGMIGLRLTAGLTY